MGTSKPPDDLEKIVLMNEVGGTNSLSKSEWMSTEATMPLEEKQTHLNLRGWMLEHAKSRGIKEEDEDDDDEDDAEIMNMLEGADVGGEDDDEPEAEKDEPSSSPKKPAEKEKE